MNLKMKGSSETILYRLVDGFSSGIDWDIKELRTLKIQGQYGFLYADGIAPNYLVEFYKNKTNAIGVLFLALRIALSSIFGTRFYKNFIKDEDVKISFDPMKAVISEKSIGIFAASIERISFNLHLFPNALESFQRFQFFSLRMPARKMVTRLAQICFKNGIQSNDNKVSDVCEFLEISRDQPFDYTLDGELFRTEGSQLQIELGPKLKFIVI